MRHVCLLLVVSACVGIAQEPASIKEKIKAEMEKETPAQRVEKGMPPSPPPVTPIDPGQALLLDLNLTPVALDHPVEVAGVTSTQRLRHKVPKPAKKAFERAAKLSKAGKRAEAARELELAIAADPGFADAHINLGAQYYMLRRPQDAERILLRATELDPSSAAAFSNLAAVELLLGRLVSAELHVRRALAMSPGNEPAKRILESVYPRIEH